MAVSLLTSRLLSKRTDMIYSRKVSSSQLLWKPFRRVLNTGQHRYGLTFSLNQRMDEVNLRSFILPLPALQTQRTGSSWRILNNVHYFHQSGFICAPVRDEARPESRIKRWWKREGRSAWQMFGEEYPRACERTIDRALTRSVDVCGGHSQSVLKGLGQQANDEKCSSVNNCFRPVIELTASYGSTRDCSDTREYNMYQLWINIYPPE